MSLFRRKSPFELNNDGLSRTPRRGGEKPQPTPEQAARARRRMLLLIGTTALSLVVYFGVAALGFAPILFVYAGLAGAMLLAYVIVNQGFVYRGATADMLPDTLTGEKKQEILAAAERRAERSRWMLIVFIALVVPLFLDALYLFVAQNLLARLGVGE